MPSSFPHSIGVDQAWALGWMMGAFEELVAGSSTVHCPLLIRKPRTIVRGAVVACWMICIPFINAAVVYMTTLYLHWLFSVQERSMHLKSESGGRKRRSVDNATLWTTVGAKHR
jgi:hypothetical protein